ncbi:MAG: tetratricopeptide repeat protein [Rhizomicrobium sp.]
MTKNLLRAAFIAALMSTASVAGMTLVATPALAADQVSKEVAKDLKAAQDAIAAKDNATAMAQIKAAQAVSDRKPYDDFVINRFLSAIAAQQQDFATAATAYDSFIATPYFNDLKPEEQKASIHDATIVAQNVKNWPKVIEYGKKLETMQGLDDIMETMLAIAYYQTKDNANAEKYAQMAIDAAKAKGKEPEPNALIIMSNVQGKNNPDAARSAIEALVLSSNNPDDWGHLIDDALSHKGTKAIDALFLFRLRNAVGASKAEDLTMQAGLASQQHLDKEAAEVLEGGINSGKLTSGQATGLSAARNAAAKDAGVLNSVAAAANSSKSGQAALSLAEDYWGYGRYADVETMARLASTKGGLKDPGEATMLLGMAQVMQGKTAEAQTTLGGVTGAEPRTRGAHLWSLYAQVNAKGAAAPAAH